MRIADSRRRSTLCAAAGVIALAAMLPACSGGDDAAASPERDVRLEGANATFGVALFDGDAWVGAGADNEWQLVRLDPADGSIVSRTKVPGELGVSGVVDDTLWVMNGSSFESVDPATGELSRGAVDGTGELNLRWSLATAAGRLFGRVDWQLMELDPQTGDIVGPFDPPLDHAGRAPEVFPAPIAGEGDVLYLTITDASTPVVAALDVVSNQYLWTAPIERTPVGVVVADGRVWVLVSRPQETQLLYAFDATTGLELAATELPDGTPMIDDYGAVPLRAAADGSVWVLAGAASTLYRIDPDTGAPTERFVFNHRPYELVVTDSAVVAFSDDDYVMIVPRSALEAVPAAG